MALLTIRQIAKTAVPLLKKNGVIRAGVFGSYAHGKATARSDIDLLIKQKGSKGLLSLVHLQYELEKKIGRKIDLTTYDGLSPYLKEKILAEEVRIL